jgi:hypothetical protein
LIASLPAYAQKLETIGAIQYRHGYLIVINWTELEERAGESYAVISKEDERFRRDIRA